MLFYYGKLSYKKIAKIHQKKLLMKPDYSDLLQRIKLQQKEKHIASQDTKLTKVKPGTTEAGDFTHPTLEELCGYADGRLRKADPLRWQWVDEHIQGCSECKEEVILLSTEIPRFRKFLGGRWKDSLSILQIIALSQAAAIIFLLGFFLFQQVRDTERQDQLQQALLRVRINSLFISAKIYITAMKVRVLPI